MAKNKSNAMWGGRFASGQDTLMETLNASIEFDQRLATQDIDGSIAHALMLGKTEIITEQDSQQIIKGLEQIREEIENNKFIFTKSLEDIHMNIEDSLTKKVGTAGKKVHTARSRNDQVATDIKLYIKSMAESLKSDVVKLQKSIIKKSEKNIDVIIPFYTHLQLSLIHISEPTRPY